MRSRSFINQAEANAFAARVIEAGGDAIGQESIESSRSYFTDGFPTSSYATYFVFYCSHTPQWVIDGLESPTVYLLRLLAANGSAAKSALCISDGYTASEYSDAIAALLTKDLVYAIGGKLCITELGQAILEDSQSSSTAR